MFLWGSAPTECIVISLIKRVKDSTSILQIINNMKKKNIILVVIAAIVAIVVAIYFLTKKKVSTVTSSLTALSPTSTLGDVISELRKTTVRTVGQPLKKVRTSLKATDSTVTQTIPSGKALVEVIWKSGTGTVIYDTETIVLNEDNKTFIGSSSVNTQSNIINPTGEVIVSANSNSEFKILVTEL